MIQEGWAVLGLIRVLVADDLPEARTLVKVNLELDGRFEVVGEATSAIDSVDLVPRLKPDVVVLGLAMPEMDHLAALSQIRRAAPGTKILVLSAFREDHSELLRTLGADGSIRFDRPMEEILDRVAEIADVPQRQ